MPAPPVAMGGADRERPSRLEGDRPKDTPDKLASVVARQIERAISAAGWPVGQVLGSEADLTDRYGVSRSVLREAVRLVEHHGAAAMRRGPHGGLVVRAPEAGPAILALVLYLEYVGTTVEDLLHARLILEPAAAALAARRVDEDGVRRLRETLATEAALNASPELTRTADLLHGTIAGLCGNGALQLFIELLTSLTARYAGAPTRTAEEAARVRAEVERAHYAMVDAIVAGDADAAHRRATRHLRALGADLDPRRRTGRGAPGPTLVAGTAGASGKLAETVARRIVEDIVAAGWPVGDVIGSEAELVERHRISRAVLREAVRLLEHHSVARMRRGPRGGLVVGEPDPAASIVAVALHLDHRRVDIEALRTVRAIVELGSLDLVMNRGADPEVARRLRASLQVETSMSSDDINSFSHILHSEIGVLSRNPVLALFSSILTSLWARHSVVPTEDSLPRIASAITHVHETIVAAVLSGDRGLARHRMVRHLDALVSWWQ